MRRIVAIAALAWLADSAGWAEPTTITVEVEPRTVGQREPVQVRVVVSGDGSQSARLDGAAPKGVKLLPSGSISTSTQMSLVNGQMSSRRVFDLTYLPSGLGVGEVPGFSVIVDGQKRRTDPVSVKIVERSQERSESSSDVTSSTPVEVQAQASRPELYVGESLVLEYVLRSRVSVQSIEPDGSPSFPGFVVEELKVEPSATQRDVRDASGAAWRQWTVMRRRLTAAKEGTLEIPALGFEVAVERRSRDFFGMAFPGQLQRVGAVAPGLAIRAKPLPVEGRPADFSGAVGRFKLSATLSPGRVAAGEAANLELTVAGDGTLAGATRPVVAVPLDVDAFDVTERTSGASKRTWVMPLVPRREGRIELATIAFAYFDPTTGSYARAEAGPLLLEATPAKRATMAPSIAATGNDSSGGEIGPFPLVEGPARDQERSVAQQALWWLALGSPWLLAATWPLASRWRAVRSGSARGQRARHRSRLRAHLAQAGVHAGSDAAESSRETLLALHLWADDLLGEPSRPLSRAQLREKLRLRLGDASLADEAVSLFARAEALRYAPGAEMASAATLIDDVTRCVEGR